MEKETAKDKKIAQLLKDLNKGDDKSIEKALNGLQKHGDASVIRPLADFWVTLSSDAPQHEQFQAFFNDLKHNDTAEVIMELVFEDTYKDIKQFLLISIWNSKVDYSEYLKDFVKLAVDGDFMQALECLTIIENMEGPFQEHQFLDAQVELSVYAESKEKEKDEQKAKIMSELAIILKEYERNHIEF